MTATEPVSSGVVCTEPREGRLRLGVKAIIDSGDRVLLVEERHEDGSEFWTLPGGGLKRGESMEAGLRRELREELGCRIDVGDPIERFWYAHTSREGLVTRYTVFASTVRSGVRADPTEGTLSFRWVRPTAPPVSTLPQVRFAIATHQTSP